MRSTAVAVCAVAVLAVLAVDASGTSASGTSTPGSVFGEGVTQPVGPARVEMELVEQRFAFAADETIRMVFRVTGDLASIELLEPVASAPVVVDPTIVDPVTGEPVPVITTVPEPPPDPVPLSIEVLNYPALTDPTGIGDLVGGDVDREAFGDDAVDFIEIANARSSAVFDDDGSVTLTVDVPTDVVNSIEERLKFERPGLYPIRIELVAGSGDARTVVATHGTIVQRLAGPGEPVLPSPPINLAVVAAVEPFAPGATSAVDQGAVERAGVAELRTATDLADALASPITLAAPPPIVSAAASTDDGAARLADSLANDEFVAGPAVAFDVSSAVAVDRADQFARQLGAGVDMLTAAVPTTPSRRDVWVATEPLSAPGAQELRDLGFRFLLMPQALYRETIDATLPDTDLFVEAALPDGQTLPIILVSSLSDDLTAPGTDAVLQSSTALGWAIGTVSTLLLEQGSAPLLQRSNVLSTPDLTAPDPRLLEALETVVATTPSVRFVPASTLTGTTDTQRADSGEPLVAELPERAGPVLDARVELLDATGLSMASAGSMLALDDPRPAEWAARLDALISTAYTDEQVTAAVADIQAEGDALRDAVIPPEPFTFTLTGRSGAIEIRVQNTSGEPLDIVVRMASPKVSFPGALDPLSDVGDHPVTLRPDDETSLEIPVRARSNGTSPITVELLTPAGQSLGEPVTLTSRVTAFTGLGQVLTAGFVLVLLSWWFAQWRRRRRAAVIDVRERHPSVAK